MKSAHRLRSSLMFGLNLITLTSTVSQYEAILLDLRKEMDSLKNYQRLLPAIWQMQRHTWNDRQSFTFPFRPIWWKNEITSLFIIIQATLITQTCQKRCQNNLHVWPCPRWVPKLEVSKRGPCVRFSRDSRGGHLFPTIITQGAPSKFSSVLAWMTNDM